MSPQHDVQKCQREIPSAPVLERWMTSVSLNFAIVREVVKAPHVQRAWKAKLHGLVQFLLTICSKSHNPSNLFIQNHNFTEKVVVSIKKLRLT
jgi:hypothetical protein